MENLKLKIHSEIYQTLVEGNINTLSAILLSTINELHELTNLSHEQLEEIRIKASEVILQSQITTVDKVPIWEKFSTGCSSIDIIMCGGIPTNGIIEIFGCSGVGKTQLCLQLALMIQLPLHLGGRDKEVLYICTEDVFPSKRFHQLSENFKTKYQLNRLDFESGVFLEHAADFEQLRRCLQVRLPRLLCCKDIGLIVIDSIAGIFRSENNDVCYTGRGQEISVIASTLHDLCYKHKIAIICLNQVTENVSAGETLPCLGLAWTNYITCRFGISRYEQNQIREFEVVFAPNLPNIRCNFLIAKEGVTAVD